MSLSTVGWGTLVLLAGLSSRTIAAYLAVSGGKNNRKEKLFVSLAWLPKATVQAALGPVALGKAKEALAKYMRETQSEQDCGSEDILDSGMTDWNISNVNILSSHHLLNIFQSLKICV